MKIRWKLFIIYSTLILVILLVSSLLFYSYTTGILQDNGYQSLYQTSASISDRLDNELEQLDQLATRIIFSDQVSDIWFHQMTNANGTVNQSSVNRLNTAVYSLAGPNLQNWEICLYHTHGTVATMGMYSAVTLEDPETINHNPLFTETLRAKGSKVFSRPYINSWNHQGPVIGVSRSFASELLATPTAVVEVQLEYDHVIRELKKVLRTIRYGDAASFWIISPDGCLLYGPEEVPADSDSIIQGTDFSPDGTTDASTDLISMYLDKINSAESQNHFSFRHADTDERMAASFIQSPYTDWIVITTLPDSILFESVYAFGKWLIIISVFALVCTILVSYLVARNLTRPLEKMHQAIRSTSLPYTLPEPERRNAQKSEPEALYDAYMQLTRQLQSSIELSAQMSVRETQARLSALQAQMNPHFLYNTISSISILSEMGDSGKVMQICRLLTDMMGYILSKVKKDTVLEDEIRFAEQYLALMKIRYEHYLEWEIDVPDELRTIPFPKLVLQPLVENCMKYATGVTPPWKICIHGFLVDDDNWRIQVTDNGLGFSESYLEFWNESKDQDDFPCDSDTSDGLGLKNTRARFRILYPQNDVFELSNLEGGGASILIGGSFRASGGRP